MADLAPSPGAVALAGPAGREIAISSWEGPLELLLEEARRRRVDLRAVSLSELVDACLARLAEIPTTAEKADQLILAATLTEMKARLLLPEAEDEDARREEAALRQRLLRLADARDMAARLMARDRLGRDVFARGAPEIETVSKPQYTADIDLLALVTAYARLRIEEEATAPLEIRRVFAMTLGEALEALGMALPEGGEWADLFRLAKGRGARASRRSVAAASFAAALEMARRGEVELSQEEVFGAVRVRRRRRR